MQSILHFLTNKQANNYFRFNIITTKQNQVVYVARNPKDAIVSFYFHHKLIKIHDYTGDVEEFAQYFMDDEIMYSPYFPHILNAWSKRNHPNMHFMFFEDMKKVVMEFWNPKILIVKQNDCQLV